MSARIDVYFCCLPGATLHNFDCAASIFAFGDNLWDEYKATEESMYTIVAECRHIL